MRTPGEIPMKVLMNKGFLATRSHASKPCVSIRERAGTRLTSMPVMPGGTGRRNRDQTFFRFTYFHGPSAARPLGWPLRMTNGKVRPDLGRVPPLGIARRRDQHLQQARDIGRVEARHARQDLPANSVIDRHREILLLT